MPTITKSRTSKYSRERLRAITDAAKAGQLTPQEKTGLLDLLRWRKGEVGWNPTGPGPGRFKTRAVPGGSGRQHAPGTTLGVNERDLPGKPRSAPRRGKLEPGKSLNRVGEGRKSMDPAHERQISPYFPGNEIYPERQAEFLPEGGGGTMTGYGETEGGGRKAKGVRARPVTIRTGDVVGGKKLTADEAKILQELNDMLVANDEPKFHVPLLNLYGEKGNMFNKAGLAHLSPEERVDVVDELLGNPPEEVLTRSGTAFKIKALHDAARATGHKIIAGPLPSRIGNQDQTRGHRAPTEDKAIRRADAELTPIQRHINKLRSDLEAGRITDKEFAQSVADLRKQSAAGTLTYESPAPIDIQSRMDRIVNESKARREKKAAEGTAVVDHRKEQARIKADLDLAAKKMASEAAQRRAAAEKKAKAKGFKLPPVASAPKPKRKRRSPYGAHKGDIRKANPAFLRSAMAAAKKWKEDLHPRGKGGKFARKPGGGTGSFTGAGLGTMTPKQRAHIARQWSKTPPAFWDKDNKKALPRPKPEDLRRIAREQGLAGMVTAQGTYKGLDAKHRDAARKKIVAQGHDPEVVGEGKAGREAFTTTAAGTEEFDDFIATGGDALGAETDSLFDALKTSKKVKKIRKTGDDTNASAESFIAELDNGQRVFGKRSGWDEDNPDWMFGDMHSEVMVAEIADRMGMTVPFTRFGSPAGDLESTDLSIVSEHIEDALPDGWTLDPVPKTDKKALDTTGIDPQELVDLMVLDFITNQGDRHIGNWQTATDAQGKRHIVITDNGGAYLSMSTTNMDKPYMPDELAAMDMAGYLGSWEDGFNNTVYINSMIQDAFGGDQKKIESALKAALKRLDENMFKESAGDIKETGSMDADSQGAAFLDLASTISAKRLRTLMDDPSGAAEALATAKTRG